MSAVATHARDAGETMNHVGQAVYAIAQLIDEDKIRKDSEGDDGFLDDFSRGCLLNGLKVLAQVLWDKGDKMLKLCDEEAK